MTLGTRWTILDRLDYLLDEQKGGFDYTSQRIVNNFVLNYATGNRLQLSVQYGAKYVLESLEGAEVSGFTDLVGGELRQDVGRRFDVGARAAQLRSWRADTRLYSYGLSVGTWPLENLWLGVGYNFAGFRDADFSAAGHTAQGWYMFFRFKFDQGNADPATRRQLMFDEAAR